MNIVLTMAGHGSRFQHAGYYQPKPLIPVNGVPMYARAMDCLPLHLATRVVFVCLEEHLLRYPLEADINERFGAYSPSVIGLPTVSQGQACTAWEARSALDLCQPLLIHNADTLFTSDLEGTLAAFPESDGVLGVFEASGDHWSFAETDAEDRVVRTAEKVRISRWASTGLYFFRDPNRFGELVGRSLDMAGEGHEIYIAPLYNMMISEGADVRLDRAISVSPLGTPGELRSYLGDLNH